MASTHAPGGDQVFAAAAVLKPTKPVIRASGASRPGVVFSPMSDEITAMAGLVACPMGAAFPAVVPHA